MTEQFSNVIIFLVYKEVFKLNFQMIDIIFVIFLFIMAIIGYIKGFVTRLYDFLGMIVVLCLSYFLTKPLSSILTIYQYDHQDQLASMIGELINQMIIFVILLIGLTIIKKLLGLAIKPVLKGIMETFALTSFVDKVLGLLLSLIEGIVIGYLALAFIVIPFVENGKTMIQDSILAPRILNIVPQVSESMMNMGSLLEFDNKDAMQPENLTKLMLTAMDMGLIDTNQAHQIFSENILNELNQRNISLTTKQKQQIEDLLQESGYTKQQIQSILSNINVSGE